MPRRTSMKRRGGRWGGSFKSFLKGANSFLKKSGLLSTLGNVGSQLVPGKWGERIGMAGNVAGSLGYGKRRRRCGGGRSTKDRTNDIVRAHRRFVSMR